MIPAAVETAVEPVTGGLRAAEPVAGGSINRGFRLTSRSGDRWFLKLNRATGLDMFEAEAEGLQALASADAVRVPEPLAWGGAGEHAWLLLEYLDFGTADASAAAALGARLAAQHRATQDQFGWHRDNTIGSTPQPNAPADGWLDFLREHRLGFQLELAQRNGYGDLVRDRGAVLLAELPALLADHEPQPSLLHGDLWGGNWGTLRDGEPVIFDPAVYYGDREADIAMTRLFGGFPPAFYEAYQAAWPLPPGFELRAGIYNLYHVLNHLNLFGGAYAGQAGSLLTELTDRVR